MKGSRQAALAALAATALSVFGGCAYKGAVSSATFPKINEAIAVILPTEGNMVSGIVRFTQMGDEVRVVADVQGFAPNSKHGFHIHEFGDLCTPNANSAGGHYNPEGYKHGDPNSKEHHAGDLGNLLADASGNAHLDLTVGYISISGAKDPILGRGLVIHGGEDDLVTQPTGNAGARVGFGVIGVANPEKSMGK